MRKTLTIAAILAVMLLCAAGVAAAIHLAGSIELPGLHG